MHNRLKAAEEMQAHSETIARLSEVFELADLLLERIPIAVAIIDDQRFVYASRRLADALGVDRDAMSGTLFNAFIHPEDVVEFAETVDAIRANALAWAVVTVRMKGAGRRWIRMRWDWGPASPDGLMVAIGAFEVEGRVG